MRQTALRLAIAASLTLGAASAARAQETPPSVPSPVSEPPDVLPGPPPAELSRAERIEKLMETLKAEDRRAARRAERAILALWLESGSDTVDLLMTWSLKALEAKNYPLALDFLDRITIMKPDYAEGWNKRATVHFLRDDYARSLADLGRTLEIEPRHFGALSGLGAILNSLGRADEAKAAYRRALEIDPHLEKVREALDALEAKTAGRQT